MPEKKNSRKNLILLTTIIVIGSFFAGTLFYKYGFTAKLTNVLGPHGVTNKKSTAREKELLYPSTGQGLSEIFIKDAGYPFKFIVYGDTREPAGYEKEAIIEEIIKEKPYFVIHLGDMVSYGEEHQWKIFDIFEGKIISNGIDFYPVLGNHEYYTREDKHPENPEKQTTHYFKRFRFLDGKHWYSFKCNDSVFLVLDTNTEYCKGSYQYKWLLEELKSKPGQRFLFIAMHHPLYSGNSYRPVRREEEFLRDVLESCDGDKLARPDIVFSSHTHNYERYKQGDINYIVSGGGGAPQHAVKRGDSDLYLKEGDNYHYCRITVWHDKVMFEMLRLNEKNGNFEIADSFTISK
ncbi:MAG: metallophosphoesterase [Candidatus Omnitrophica bacterium]|nr:metallophosphoesterase [Candidatus Omnitrophota bacterium]